MGFELRILASVLLHYAFLHGPLLQYISLLPPIRDSLEVLFLVSPDSRTKILAMLQLETSLDNGTPGDTAQYYPHCPALC
jgi:hypothetical protein